MMETLRKVQPFLLTIWLTGKFNLGLLLVILILASLEPYAGDLLRFDRHAIADGELWRLFSGHLVHLGWAHTFLNLTGLGLITIVFQQELEFKSDCTALLFCCAGTTLGIYYLSPTMIWYVGLSGALHGYFIYYLIKGYKVSPIIAALTLIIMVGKVIWEQTPWGDTSSTEQLIGGAVAVDSHLYGSAAGIIVGFASLFWVTRRDQQSNEKN